MRVLVTYLTDNGDLKAAIVTGRPDEEADPCDIADVAWQKSIDGANSSGIYTVVTLPDETGIARDFRPDVFDEYGAEAPMQFIDL